MDFDFSGTDEEVRLWTMKSNSFVTEHWARKRSDRSRQFIKKAILRNVH